MAQLLVILHTVMNNAYILFCLALGVWCILKVIRTEQLDGQFWGAVAINTGLAVAMFVVALLMWLMDIRAKRWAYYLYAIFFVIVLPGTFSLLRGRDDRLAVIIFGIVTVFAGASATRVPLLVQWPDEF